MNSNAIPQAMMRQIVARTRCSVCGHSFSMNDIRVIGRRDNAWAMSVTCRECRTQALLLAVVAGGEAHHVRTDLVPTEWERFKSSEPVSTNDVIEFYRHLDSYDGDFSEILEEPLPPR